MAKNKGCNQFQSFVSQNELSDLGFQGSLYT